jgi:hypothetical protein
MPSGSWRRWRRSRPSDAERAVTIMATPPVTVGDLAAASGLRVSDLLAEGEESMGFVPVPPRASAVSASFEWDIHHEEPVRSPDALARRVLTSYSVRFARGPAPAVSAGFSVQPAGDGFVLSWRPLVAPLEDPAAVAERLRAAAAFDEKLRVPAAGLAVALGAPGAYAQSIGVHMDTWVLELTIGGHRLVATLEAPPTGEPVPGVSIPAAMACALGEADVVSHLRMEAA